MTTQTAAFSRPGGQLRTPAFPFRVTWDITHKCNLRCSHCFVVFQEKRSQFAISEAIRSTIASAIVKLRPFIVSISGGEPFLVPELPFLLQVFLENGIDVVVATNGLLMNPESIRHLAALSNRLHFQVSLDGSCADTHNQIRGAETFERTVAVIQRAVAFFPITMAFTVTSRSFREIPAVIDLASKLQCSAVKLQRFIPTATVPDQTLALSIAQRDEAISLVRGSLSAGRLGSLELFDCISPRTGCGRERSDLVCGPGLSECTITPDGSVVKCGAILDSTPRFGNVVEESFADIWTRLSMSSLGEGSGGCLCQA